MIDVTANVLEETTTPLNRRVATGLSKIAVALKSHSWQEAGARGITPTQGQVLTFLHARPEYSAILSVVADGLAISDATACEAVRAMEKKLLVKKIRSKVDARFVTIALTAKGVREATRVGTWPEFLDAAIDTLPKEQQEAFLGALIKTIRALQEQGDIPVSQMCVTCKFFRPNVHEEPDQPHHCAFVDAAFGERLLRLDCPEHQLGESEERARNWAKYMSVQSNATMVS